MGFRIQRSIKLGKFVRMNISKSGIGFSAGFPGFRIGTGPRGSYINLGVPGTGLSYRKKLSISGQSKNASDAAQSSEEPPDEMPSPGFFAPGAEKNLYKGLIAYREDRMKAALVHLKESASEEAGAAIILASILARRGERLAEAAYLLEQVVQSEEEFPTPLMEKYLADVYVDIDITPHVTAPVPVDGLAATLLLVELYQARKQIPEAIALLEEIEELVQDSVFTLSLCELYTAQNMWDQIIERANQIESEDNVTLETMIYYGRALQEKGLHEAAIRVFTKALRRRKDRSQVLLNEARYRRIDSYQAVGKKRRVDTELQRLFADDPNFRDVAERLEAFRDEN